MPGEMWYSNAKGRCIKMSQWDPEKYLLFEKQRTQPAIDLAMRVRGRAPKTVADIGCGPGNSTQILKETFPEAHLVGVDNSETMIEEAEARHPEMDFVLCSAQELSGSYDLLFSNACLQWIPDHEMLLPLLMSKVNPGGALAVQMPMNWWEPLYCIIREAAAESRWDFSKTHFEQNDVLAPEEYDRILGRCSRRHEIWETVYYHAMPSHESLLDWVRSTRLRPYLDALGEEDKPLFEAEILRRTKEAYPFTENGDVIFKFRRFFFIAEK